MSRQTEQRRVIREIFEEIPRPLTPTDVLESAQKKLDGIGIATVYRKVELANEPARYERADLEHHHHFHCKVCDRVFDLPGCAGSVNHLVPSGFTLTGHEVTLYGQCDTCTSPGGPVTPHTHTCHH
jgi:Fur family transcriptional regulator, ferric uptake regulator